MPQTPRCIGIILDGNRRWAKERGLPKLEGHRRGYERVIDCTRWVRDRGIKHFVAYAFSTENWNREAEEISYFMEVLREMAKKDLRDLAKERVRVRFIGTLNRFDPDIREAMQRAEKESEHNDAITLWICLSYGGRAEIAAAARAAASDGKEITEESLRAHFWSAEMPDPDIIIRTSGEMRLSNFLLWQAAYSELFFIKPHWPDFSEEALGLILKEFAERKRRFGT